MPASVLMLLPSGTMSNESLHREINSWFRQVQRIHKASLALKLDVLGLAKAMVHDRAMAWPTARQMSADMVLARSVAHRMWTPKSWRAWCRTLQRSDGSAKNKAVLPIHSERQAQADAVRKWVFQRPAVAKRPSGDTRRTALTRPREHLIVRGGVKDTPYR